jgi:hypothetical protein
MTDDQNNSGVEEVRAAYLPEPEAMSGAERAWLDAEIDRGLASPPKLDRAVQQVMAEIKAKNRASHG